MERIHRNRLLKGFSATFKPFSFCTNKKGKCFCSGLVKSFHINTPVLERCFRKEVGAETLVFLVLYIMLVCSRDKSTKELHSKFV